MKVSFKGIAIGGITDVVLSGILGIPLSIYVISTQGLLGLPKDQLGIAAVEAIHSNVGLYSVQLFIGLSCSIFGGYIAAWLAKHDEILNGVLASWLCVGIGVYSLVFGKASDSVPLHFALVAITPICYALGAYLRQKGVRTGTATV